MPIAVCLEAVDRPKEIQALVDAVPLAPPELAADILIRIAESRQVTDRNWKLELLEQAFYTAAGARYGVALVAAVGSARNVGSDAGVRDSALQARLDALSLRCRAVSATLRLDRKRALDLFQEIPPMPIPAHPCSDALTESPDIFFTTLGDVLARAFTVEERIESKQIDLAESHLQVLTSPTQLAPAVGMVAAQKLRPDELVRLAGAVVNSLQRMNSDDRTFSAATNPKLIENLATFAALCRRSQYSPVALVTGVRGYLARHLHGARCAEVADPQARHGFTLADSFNRTLLPLAGEGVVAPLTPDDEHVIHSFGEFTKGANPYGALIRDTAGNLYGTTYQGGSANMGTVFKLNASGYDVLYSFKGGTDAASPLSGVAIDFAGNLYGTTYNGGTANAGAVYKLEPSGQETVLYSFTGGADGYRPYAGVIVGATGNLYGTTYYGGASGKGVVYDVSPSGQEAVLHSFTGGSDGGYPYAGVIADPSGNLYGTTYAGGITTGPCYYIPGCGVVYKLDTAGRETVLHAFAGESSTLVGWPYAGVIRDSGGNLYGTTSAGAGGVYEVGSAGGYTVLHEFFTGPELSQPKGGLALDSRGSLYGTTQYGGAANAGGIYELDKAGKLRN